MSDWHARIQRTQHLAIGLAKLGHPCFVLNPHLGRQFPSTFLSDSSSQFALLGSRLVEIHARLPREPVYHARCLLGHESARLAKALSRLHPSIGRSLVQIVSLPTWLDASLLLRTRFGWPIVYDCHDWIAGFRNVAPEIVATEARLLQAADFVFFSSQNLQELHTQRLRSLGANSIILRNATAPAHFSSAARSQDSNSGRPLTVGYFGALDEWFDIDVLRACAKHFPELKFQLIGRVEYAPIHRLAEFRNVEFCGEIPYERLPDFAADFAVALIPFRNLPLTRATNPIKLYEYFSCGVPVVSARLPEVELFGDMVYLADDAPGYIRGIERALGEMGSTKRLQRIAVAQRETWDARAVELLAPVVRLLPKSHATESVVGCSAANAS